MLSTATFSHYHAIVAVLVCHRTLFVNVQYGDGFKTCWNTADWRRSTRAVDRLDKTLDDGIFGWSQMIAEREIALSNTLVRLYTTQTFTQRSVGWNKGLIYQGLLSEAS